MQDFKKKVLIFFVIIYRGCCCFGDNLSPQNISSENLQVTVGARDYSKIKCLMLSLSEDNVFLQMAKVMKFDLEFTDQVDVELKKTDIEPDNKVLLKIFKEGTSLCAFLKEESDDKVNKEERKINITIKEPSSGRVVFQKTFNFKNKNVVHDSHVISDSIIPVLTGQHGPMLSTLAYCKQLSNKCKAICISDYACKQEKILYTSKRINLAPRWHTQAPVLFFSQITRDNNRLMSIDLNTNRLKVVCPYEGLNMQPSFSEDGLRAVMCMSGKKNSELYLYDQAVCKKLNKKVFTQLTNNGENNISPCYLPNGDVVFCSDFETGQPQIYYLDTKLKKTIRITNGKGYCAAPSFCRKNNTVVYCRLVKGYFQLFTVNIGDTNMLEKQITFDNASKQEPVWSECGNYIAFSIDFIHPNTYKNVPQIAIFNMLSKKTKILTFDDKPKSFPCWTPKTYYS